MIFSSYVAYPVTLPTEDVLVITKRESVKSDQSSTKPVSAVKSRNQSKAHTETSVKPDDHVSVTTVDGTTTKKSGKTKTKALGQKAVASTEIISMGNRKTKIRGPRAKPKTVETEPVLPRPSLSTATSSITA